MAIDIGTSLIFRSKLPFFSKYIRLANCCVIVEPPLPCQGFRPSRIFIRIAPNIPLGLIPQCE